MPRSVLLGFLVLILSGCDQFGGVACTTDVRPSFIVTVTDSITGDTLGEGVRGRSEALFYADTLTPYQTDSLGRPLSFIGPWELGGSYTITIEHPDHLTWQRSGVAVDKGECHVTTRELTARMTPTS